MAMAIEFECPTCRGTLQVGDESAGRVIRCGACMTALRVPAADPSQSGSLPPANPYDHPYSPPVSPPPPPRSDDPTEVEPLPDEFPASARPVSPRRERNRDEYEDERRERRTRRRPPPPPAGKGVFFWLVVIGAVMLVGVIGCCGGLYLFLPKTKWQTYESQAGGFEVKLPGKPHPDVAQVADVQLEKGTHAEGTVLLRRGAMKFMVIYRDIESTKDRLAKNRRATDEQELEQRVTKLEKGMGTVRILRNDEITVDGFLAREVELQTQKGWHTARVIIADSRVYIVLAGGGTSQPGDPDVRQFMDSFKITDQKLLNEGKRREEQAKREAEKEKAVKERKARPNAEDDEEQKTTTADEFTELCKAAKAVVMAVEETGLDF
jgi:hypothetical protein